MSRTGPKPKTWDDIVAEFPGRTRKEGDCLVWTGARDSHGYGRLQARAIAKAPLYAHIVAWEIANGPVPAGLEILHRCDNPPCVLVTSDPETSHLIVGTHLDNMRDAQSKGRLKIGGNWRRFLQCWQTS